MAEGDFADAIALLKADHRTVENLFFTFAHSRDQVRRARLARRICTELRINAAIEEEIFLPALRGRVEDRLLDEVHTTLGGQRILIGRIEAGDSDPSRIEALREAVAGHFGAEERPRDGMFARCREAKVDLVALRDAMRTRKETLTALVESGGTVTPLS